MQNQNNPESGLKQSSGEHIADGIQRVIHEPRYWLITIVLSAALSVITGGAVYWYMLGQVDLVGITLSGRISELEAQIAQQTTAQNEAEDGQKGRDEIDMSGWKIYESQERGIAYQYPSSWKLVSVDISKFLSGYDINAQFGYGMLPNDNSVSIETLVKDYDFFSLNKQDENSYPAYGISSVESVKTKDDKDAVLYFGRASGGASFGAVFIPTTQNDQVVAISYTAPGSTNEQAEYHKEIFKKIISTFYFDDSIKISDTINLNDAQVVYKVIPRSNSGNIYVVRDGVEDIVATNVFISGYGEIPEFELTTDPDVAVLNVGFGDAGVYWESYYFIDAESKEVETVDISQWQEIEITYPNSQKDTLDFLFSVDCEFDNQYNGKLIDPARRAQISNIQINGVPAVQDFSERELTCNEYDGIDGPYKEIPRLEFVGLGKNLEKMYFNYKVVTFGEDRVNILEEKNYVFDSKTKNITESMPKELLYTVKK